MADKISLFRIMAREVAQEFGLLATFMPKPYTGSWGSGHHANMSLADVSTGENLFRGTGPDGEAGWSELTYSFVAGILKHARAIAAVATPTVNSYKRLTARLRDGEISWAPIWASYGDNNRSCMIRLPRNRPAIENRAVDSAANTYLATALIVAAGLEGIEKNLHPGEPVTSQTYDWQTPPPNATRLPRTLRRGDRRVRRRPPGARDVRPAVHLRLRHHEERGVGRLPRRSHRLGTIAVPAQSLTAGARQVSTEIAARRSPGPSSSPLRPARRRGRAAGQVRHRLAGPVPRQELNVPELHPVHGRRDPQARDPHGHGEPHMGAPPGAGRAGQAWPPGRCLHGVADSARRPSARTARGRRSPPATS